MNPGGTVAPGFEPVRDAFPDLVAPEGGTAMAAYIDGRAVVDLWGGAVGRDTLVHTWSAIKPVTGACLLLLVEHGRIGLDDPVASVWPELRAGADGRLLVRHVLSHTAGLASVPPPGTLESLVDWDATCAGLAAAEPDWEPGAAVGEHALTYGHLVGELVRRVDGRPLGRFLAEEIVGPLGLDVHIGLGAADLVRVADTVVPAAWTEARTGSTGLRARALDIGIDEAVVNSGAWRQAEIPAVNGHATARGLAGFWQAHLDGRLPAGLDVAGAEGEDLVLGGERVVWTLAGGRLEGPDVGMGGLGGQWACARPSAGLAWAFLTTVLGDFGPVDALEHVLLSCL